MRILIDNGHCLSGADTGAQGNGYREEVCTREISSVVVNKLRELGHTASIVSPDYANSVNESLNARTNKANSIGGDIFVSIHLNAGGGQGVEIYTYNRSRIAEAINVLDNLVKLGYRNRGIKDGSGLAVIRNTSMNAMLVECGFIDTKSDMDIYNADKIADAIVKGLVGQTIETSKPEAPKPPVNNNNIIKEYAENGMAEVCVDKLNVRDAANTNATIVASYSRNEEFNYDRVVITNDYVWVSYVSYSGSRRYVAVKDKNSGERLANCY